MLKIVSARCPVTWRFLCNLCTEGLVSADDDAQEEVQRIRGAAFVLGRGYGDQTARGFYLLELALKELVNYCHRLRSTDTLMVERVVHVFRTRGRSAQSLTQLLEGLREVGNNIIAQQMDNLLTAQTIFAGPRQTPVNTSAGMNAQGVAGAVISSNAVKVAIEHLTQMAEHLRASLSWRYRGLVATPTKSLGALGTHANKVLRLLGVGSLQRLNICALLLQISTDNLVSPWNSNQPTV